MCWGMWICRSGGAWVTLEHQGRRGGMCARIAGKPTPGARKSNVPVVRGSREEGASSASQRQGRGNLMC
eukprot:6925463-Prymnesium_polylepis.2